MSEEKKSNLKNWIVGCSLALLVTAVLCAGGIWLGATRGVDMVLEKVTGAMVDGMREARFPEQEVAGIEHHLDRLLQARTDGTVGFEELGEFLEDLSEHRIHLVAMVQLFEEHYLVEAELPVDESARAAIDLQRFARGIWEETIAEERFGEVFRVEDWNFQAKNNDDMEFSWEDEWDSPARLQEILAAVREEVETAEIPAEPFHLGLADEFGKIVDQALDG